MTVYNDLIAAGVECKNHYSDLYFQRTETTIAIVEKWRKLGKVFKSFVSGNDGKIYYELSFGYDPYWIERSM